MRPFTYERAESPAAAAKAAAETPDARFLAGGTNLLDLMKLEIERPLHLIDVGRRAPRRAHHPLEYDEGGGRRPASSDRRPPPAALRDRGDVRRRPSHRR